MIVSVQVCVNYSKIYAHQTNFGIYPHSHINSIIKCIDAYYYADEIIYICLTKVKI